MFNGNVFSNPESVASFILKLNQDQLSRALSKCLELPECDRKKVNRV